MAEHFNGSIQGINLTGVIDMAQTVKLKRSNTASAEPGTGDLALGELGMNTRDGKVYMRKYVDGTDGNDTIITVDQSAVDEAVAMAIALGQQMANTFKNKQAVNVGTSTVSVYTVPSSTTTTLIGLTLANVSGASITATVAVTDTSASTTANIIKNAPIPVGSSLVACGGDQKVVLETTDILKVTASAANSVDAIVSYMEQT